MSRVVPLNGQTCHFIMSLKVLSCSLPPSVARVGGGWVYLFSLVIFFLSPLPISKCWYSLFLVFQSLFLWFLFFYPFYKNSICFQFSHSIIICYILFFQFSPYSFIFKFFFLGHFVKVYLIFNFIIFFYLILILFIVVLYVKIISLFNLTLQ
jgi:hypothetical protein